MPKRKRDGARQTKASNKASFDRALTAADRKKIERVFESVDESWEAGAYVDLQRHVEEDSPDHTEVYITKRDLDAVLAGRKRFHVVEPQGYDSISVFDLNHDGVKMHRKYIDVDGRGIFYPLDEGGDAVVGTGSGFDRYFKITDQFMRTVDRLLRTDLKADSAQRAYDRAVSRERDLEERLQNARRATAEASKRLVARSRRQK